MMGDAWTEYGFAPGKGNPFGIENSLAADGLIKAMAERRNAYCKEEEQLPLDSVGAMMLGIYIKWDVYVSYIIAPSYIEMFTYWLDDAIKSACFHYLDHVAYGKDRTCIRRWTFESLSEAVSEINGGESIIPYRMDTLFPEWFSEYARQRYQMINLLKIVFGNDLEFEIYAGYVHNGRPQSPDEACNAAMAQMQKRTERLSIYSMGIIGIYGKLRDYRMDIYGPSHGWKEGSYCCDCSYTAKIKSPRKRQLMLDVEPINEFEDFGTGLHVGMNLLDLDENGEINWPLASKRPSYAHAFPVKNVDVTYGWQAVFAAYVHDASKDFTFFHDIG